MCCTTRVHSIQNYKFQQLFANVVNVLSALHKVIAHMHCSICAVLQKLDYQWYQTGVVEPDCDVHILSWNQEGALRSVIVIPLSSCVWRRHCCFSQKKIVLFV